VSRAMRNRVRAAVPLPLALLLAAALAGALAWALVTPPLQGPDEPAHAAYVQLLAETGTKPSPAGGDGPHSTELQAALDLGFTQTRGALLARAPATPADRAVWEERSAGLGAAGREDGTGPTLIAGNPPLFYATEVPAYWAGRATGDLFTSLTLMRVTNVLLMLIGLACVWALAGEVLRGRVWLQTVATGVVALHPKLASLAATVNTDALLFTLVSATMLAAVRLLRRGPTVTRVLVLAALCLACASTQGRGLAVLVPAALAVGLAVRRHRPPVRLARRVLGVAGASVVAGVVLVVAVNAAIAPPGSAAFAGEVGRVVGQEGGFNPRELASYVWQFYLPGLSFMEPMLGPPYGFRQVFVETFFGATASLEVHYAGWVYDLLQAGMLVGLAAFAAAAWRRRRLIARRWDLALVLAAFPLAELALLHLNSYKQLKLNPLDPIITGRYLVPLLAAFGLAVAFTLTPLPRRAAAVAGGVLLGLAAALQVSGLGLTIVRFHA
jgi:4-amino-4-deoxy-L-arabinose transferase-like glycosyltransferase